MPDRRRGEDLDALLAAIGRGLDAEPINLGGGIPSRLSSRLDAITPLAAVLVATRAAAQDLAPTLVATRDEIQEFLASALTDGPLRGTLAEGWRHDLVGRSLVDLAEGRLALAGAPDAPFVTEVPLGAGAPGVGAPPDGDVE
jgi:ribonuclease D